MHREQREKGKGERVLGGGGEKKRESGKGRRKRETNGEREVERAGGGSKGVLKNGVDGFVRINSAFFECFN